MTIISNPRNTLAALAITAMPLAATTAAAQTEKTTLNIYNKVTFYDEYLVKNLPDEAKNLDDGIQRYTTSSYSKKLTDEQLDQIGSTLDMKLRVYACCDNYDRIGNVNLAFVPKGSEGYEYDDVKRIEIGRFITPFMDKNKNPKAVTYRYSVDYLSYILRDARLRSQYDIWMEYEIFGIPYAANTQIAGCSGRNDVFQASLDLITSQPAAGAVDNDVLVPVTMKHPDYQRDDLNNYSTTATDTIGKTTRTYTFEVPEDVADAQLVIVTSNHGSGGYQDADGTLHQGEEYCRRMHFIYYDDALSLAYKPGRTSCEPYRTYNTQRNGIYGYSRKTDEDWQSFSNWCPGDVIDNRIVRLGAVKAGTHKVRISVPDAEFNGNSADQKDGNIPVSIFFQGLTSGELPTGIGGVKADSGVKADLTMAVSGGKLTVKSSKKVVRLELYSIDGRLLSANYDGRDIALQTYGKGVYVASAELESGAILTKKIVFGGK